jgi:hypothetical protein
MRPDFAPQDGASELSGLPHQDTSFPVKRVKQSCLQAFFCPPAPTFQGSRSRFVGMWVAEGEDALSVADLLRPRLSAARCAQLDRVFRAEV